MCSEGDLGIKSLADLSSTRALIICVAIGSEQP